jgi:hypothetical protein
MHSMCLASGAHDRTSYYDTRSKAIIPGSLTPISLSLFLLTSQEVLCFLRLSLPVIIKHRKSDHQSRAEDYLR